MWKSHYEDLFNCLSNNKDVNNICKNAEYQRDVEVSPSEIINAIKDLKDNKSCGLDGISAEHLKHCSDVIIPLSSMCFTSLFVHGILPEFMISVVLVPIVKNKNASICSKSNYRPIALASIVSKVFFIFIYDRIAYSLIGPASGSRYMAWLRATGAYWGLSETNWGLDTRIIF